jgi:hypothetical protein
VRGSAAQRESRRGHWRRSDGPAVTPVRSDGHQRSCSSRMPLDRALFKKVKKMWIGRHPASLAPGPFPLQPRPPHRALGPPAPWSHGSSCKGSGSASSWSQDGHRLGQRRAQSASVIRRVRSPSAPGSDPRVLLIRPECLGAGFSPLTPRPVAKPTAPFQCSSPTAVYKFPKRTTGLGLHIQRHRGRGAADPPRMRKVPVVYTSSCEPTRKSGRCILGRPPT